MGSFLFFWGHTPKHEGVADSSCLSQWFVAPFVLDGIVYPTAEHFMMAEKARLFRDDRCLAQILAAKTPAEAKAFGRTVRDYSEEAWANARLAAVIRGNLAKFGQHASLGAFLRGTGERVLVEASPTDTVWGIGLHATDPDARIPERWRGQNLLGVALMEVRKHLAATTASSLAE